MLYILKEGNNQTTWEAAAHDLIDSLSKPGIPDPGSPAAANVDRPRDAKLGFLSYNVLLAL